MEQMLINMAGTLAFGGGGIVAVAYIYHRQFNKIVETNNETVQRICESHEKTVERNASAFEAAMQTRDDQLKRFIDSAIGK